MLLLSNSGSFSEDMNLLLRLVAIVFGFVGLIYIFTFSGRRG
jgi:hypothetical protein